MLWLSPLLDIFRSADPPSIVREGVIGCLATVAPPALQNTGRLLQRLLVEDVPAAVAGQRVH